MARTLDRSKLPTGSTALLHNGVVYCIADNGSTTDVNGNPIELPDDFPDDKTLEGNLARAAASPGGRMAPMTSKAGGAQAGAQPDYEAMTREELADEAERRGVAIKRADGEGGSPLKADYIKALTKADKK